MINKEEYLKKKREIMDLSPSSNECYRCMKWFAPSNPFAVATDSYTIKWYTAVRHSYADENILHDRCFGCHGVKMHCAMSLVFLLEALKVVKRELS